MAWGEINIMNQREMFAKAALEGSLSMAELCRQYQISRPTGYLWVKRYKEKGRLGLINMSRAPHNQPLKTPPALVKPVIQLRIDRPTWGPNKIRARLALDQPDVKWPSTTTIGNHIESHGLVVPRKYRTRVPGRTSPLSHCHHPNDVWCMDFKGWVLTADGQKFDPFTLTDADTRFIIKCAKLPSNDVEHVWGILDKAFREYGLPKVIRSDNGAPFAAMGPGRLSRLSVMIIKAGVTPEWIDPGKPQQNGRHERMHLTLQQDTQNYPRRTISEHSNEVNKFVYDFNYRRPHEALGQVPPGMLYTKSTRQWHGMLKAPEYPSNYEVRKVRSSGNITWRYTDIFLGRCLNQEYVSIIETADDIHEIRYGPVILGIINKNNEFIVPGRKKKDRKPNPENG